MSRLVVVGSLNLDLVLECERIPVPGETVLASGFRQIPGGKGANQAYAAARLTSVPVAMVGRVGSDSFGAALRQNLAQVGVNTRDVLTVDEAPTGIAIITVDRGGQNSIVVSSGANFVWNQIDDVFAGASFVLFQLETPLEAVTTMAGMAKAHGAFTILDPAPARPLPQQLLDSIDLLTPNESEAAALGLAPDEKVLIKQGASGSTWGELHVPTIPVEAMDTTAAGDTYNAALAVALCEGESRLAAMQFATIAAGLSVTRIGAQTSAPTRAEVESYRLKR